jgi:urease accessory protein
VAGGVQAGDCLDVELELGSGAQALVTTQSATKILRMHEGEAIQRNQFSLGPDALLEYLPDEVIPFAGSRCTQETYVEMAPSARLILAELLTPGRVARDEHFEFSTFTWRLHVQRDGRLVLREAASLTPATMNLSGTGLLGGWHYYGSFAAVAPLADGVLADLLDAALAKREGILGSASAATEVVVARVLGRSLEPTKAALRDLWQLARRYVVGQSLSGVPGKITF